MNYRNILPLVSNVTTSSTDNWNDFGSWCDGTIWYEKTPTYTSRVTAYATATGITDYTILDPLNIFDLGLTYYGLDTIMKAVYPMVTDKTSQSDMANQMKYNFMNPLDTNPAFRLNWVGGWIYSRTGALPNGTNAYADTFLTPSTALSLNSTHISFYSRTDNNGSWDMGCNISTPGTRRLELLCKSSSTSFYGVNSSTESSISNTNGTGLYIANRTSSTIHQLIKNNTINSTSASSVGLPTRTVFIGGGNLDGGNLYGSKQCAFSSIGDGLTDFQADIFSSLVNNLQKALNRDVY